MATHSRLRDPVDAAYLIALGQAMYCFASLEWTVARCMEKIGEKGHSPKISSHYIETVPAKTAEQIAREFMAALDGMTDAALGRAIKPAADRFRALAKRRNELIHAKPGTAPNGNRRLFYKGSEWAISDLEELSDKFAECNMMLSDLHSKVL